MQVPTRPGKQRKNDATVNQEDRTSRTAETDAAKAAGGGTRASMDGDDDGENINVTPRKPNLATPTTMNTANTDHGANGQRALNSLSHADILQNKSSHQSAAPSPTLKPELGVLANSQPLNAVPKGAQDNMPPSPPKYNTNRMTVAQKNALQEKLSNLKRTKNSMAFLKPVDTLALNIPTYTDVVKRPMDLNTMQKKLQGDKYESVQAFANDFYLIVSNAYLFNGEMHPVTQTALAMEAYFKRMMQSVPQADEVTSRKR